MNKSQLKSIIKEMVLEVVESLETPDVPEGDWTKAEFATNKKPVYSLKESHEEITTSENLYMLDEELSEYHNLLKEKLFDKIREDIKNLEPEDNLNEDSIIESVTEDFLANENPDYTSLIAEKFLPILGMSKEETKQSIEEQDEVFLHYLQVLEKLVMDFLSAEFSDAVESITEKDDYPSDYEIFGSPQKLHRGY